jgi:dihydrofolate reductase
MRAMITIVVAHSRNRVIGHRGALPWHLPSDLRRFKQLTVGRTVVMGRKTFESLPDAYRPLPERRNLVLSADPAYEAPGAEVYPSLDAALTACEHDCVVIGGETLYAQALPLAERVHVTHVEAEPAGDAFFPELPDAAWRCVERSQPTVENDLAFAFHTYERAA